MWGRKLLYGRVEEKKKWKKDKKKRKKDRAGSSPLWGRKLLYGKEKKKKATWSANHVSRKLE